MAPPAVPDGSGAEARLDTLVALALDRSPRLAGRAEMVAAGRASTPAAGALPDPMLGLGATGERYPGAGIGEDPMAMASLELVQVIPWPGKRGRREDAAAAAVAVARGEFEIERRELAAEVRAHYAGIVALDEQARALREADALLGILEPTVAARYVAGTAEQGDLVRLRIERLQLRSDLDATAADRAELAAALAAALDTTAAVTDPTDGALPPVTALPATAVPDSFAAVARARAEVARARLAARAAEHERNPDFQVGAEYGWRDALPPMVTLRVGVGLPVWSGRKQGALAAGARHELAVADAALREARAAAAARSATLHARQAAAAVRAARLRTEILPQAALVVAAERAGYAAGRGGLDRLVAGLRLVIDARAELAREEAEHYAAWARLRALAGLDPQLQHKEH